MIRRGEIELFRRYAQAIYRPRRQTWYMKKVRSTKSTSSLDVRTMAPSIGAPRSLKWLTRAVLGNASLLRPIPFDVEERSDSLLLSRINFRMS